MTLATHANLPAVATSPPELRVVHRRYFPVITRFIHGYYGLSADDAADVAQDVFVTSIGKSLPATLEECRPWLYRIARLTMQNRLKKGTRYKRALHALALEGLGSAPPDPLTELQTKASVEALNAILSQLNEDLRVVFVLYELEGLSLCEIAAVLEIRIDTVKSRLHRARQAFSKIVHKLEGSRQ